VFRAPPGVVRLGGMLVTLFELAASTDSRSGVSQMSNLAATRALLELGVFEAIPTGGKSMTADELAVKTGGEKELIGESSQATQ